MGKTPVVRPRPKPRQGPQDFALRALLADIVQSSGDAIFSRKLDGTSSSWNAAAERIFGYTAKAIVGRSSQVLLPPARPDEIRELLGRVGQTSGSPMTRPRGLNSR